MRKLHTISSYLIVALGVVHISLTGRTFGEWISPPALFFIGAGLAIVLLGCFNFVLRRTHGDSSIRTICLGANAAGVALFAVGIAALPLPQVFALFGLLVITLITGALLSVSSSPGPSGR